MTEELRRIAIVNRGEAAMRLIHAVRELAHEQRRAVRSVALFTRAEQRAMFVREADEAVCIDDDRAPGAASAYLDLDALRTGLIAARADAAWVGWGFVAERPEFAELCDELGVVFVGPSAAVMRRLGDKIGAKLLAEEAGVPVAAWSGGPVGDLDDARRHAARIGYPLMIKATAGGGGRGIRRVDDERSLESAFESARAEGLKAFGDPTVFLERVVTDARHVEVQIIADTHGTAWAVGVRDCTVQRRNQKVIEESHSTALSADQERELRTAASRLAELAGYQNAGTVEFLYQPVERQFAFLEVNTRLQVEHPVTELTTGLDLVKLQLHVAAGGRLHGDPPASFGHAIEARLNAEDPQRGFAPAPGRIEMFSVPVGPGVRVDTGVGEGDVIPPEYDSMIAKVVAWGRDRREARARLSRALSQTTVVIDSGTTNKAFLLDLLERPELAGGEVDTGWLDRLTAAEAHRPTEHADVALLAAAIEAYQQEAAAERATFFSWARRGRPQARSEIGRELELRHGTQTYRVRVAQVGRDRYRVRLDGRAVTAAVEPVGRSRSRLQIGGRTYRVVCSVQGADHLVEIDGVAHRFSRDDGGLVRAPAAALVVAVHVGIGDDVEAGAPVAVVEAMKMEIVIAAPAGGRVRDVFVARNVQVEAGAPLVRIESAGGQETAAESARVSFAGLTRGGPGAEPDEGPAGSDGVAPVELLRSLMLGYEVDATDVRPLLGALRGERGLGAGGPAVGADAGLGILAVFADLCALTRDRRRDDDGEAGLSSPQEFFNRYLRTRVADDLPERFRLRLLRALAHYGVTSLDGGPLLDEALHRLYLSQQRRTDQVPVVLAVLEGLRSDRRATAERPAELRDTLDRLIDATQRRFPGVGSLARSVRHACFDQPIVDRARDDIRMEMAAHLAQLQSAADPGERQDHLTALVACPLPLLPIGAASQLLVKGSEPGTLLEVLTRRYYKIRSLEQWRAVEGGDGEVYRAEYHHSGRRVHVLCGRAKHHRLAAVLGVLSAVADTIPAGETAVVDLYLGQGEGDDATVDALGEELRRMLDVIPPPPSVRRVALIACRIHPRLEVQHLSLRRPAPDGERPFWMDADEAHGSGAFEEDRKFRGIHPMIARRLHLWRLANFDIERLASPDDVQLFECVGRTNSADRRLVAVAEVRDLTPVRDADGQVLALPEVEHVLAACLDAIRRARADRSERASLEWNRVMLYVWPSLDLPLDEVSAVARRLAPLTEGLGIEQIVVQGRFAGASTEETSDIVMRVGYDPERGLTIRFTEPPTEPMQPLDDYTQKVLQARRRGTVYPYELLPLLCGPGGRFTEHDLDDAGALTSVTRPPGGNSAGVVVGVVTTPTDRHPEGMTRVALLGDPTKAMGSIAEPECRRLLAAIDLADELGVPIEWFALSAGAKIAMDSGSENLDWVARVLRRIVEHTQRGGEINVVVAGINVGAQPYWNAESTMLMHTRGILVMTPDSAMVLTGKQAIDYSGGVSAENNLGIGGYERVMGPNGEAQYWAPDLSAACAILRRHYEHSYVAPGERWARPASTSDPFDRDVRGEPHVVDGSDFATVGDIFSATVNPDRKKPFDIRTVIRAVIDRDHEPLERWPEMAEAETAVVMDARLGGRAVTVVGTESRLLPRHGETPADGPASWSAGTLFPLSSKKVARAINAASGNRPVVVLANLSGFDGSPESLRRLQLEYGAEIGRAIVNFDGPIVLCVISRYHGGAFVVFSATLNDDMEVLAVEGSFASVIGGAPAAAVVFTGEVRARTDADPRVRGFEARIASAETDAERARLRGELAGVREVVRTEKLGEVAAEFDAIHSVERALAVGSVHRIVPAASLRPALVDAVARGIARAERATLPGRPG